MSFHGIYSAAPNMQNVFERLRRVARAECTVLIGGESGTGKELAARAIHAESPQRRFASFRAVNCATLSPTLLESELFGHVRGAFTGAVCDRQGLFAAAHKGSVLLDEVAEISLELQGRLLRVLQERSFCPVGSTRAVDVDVRVISATNKDLRTAVADARFREDLMYRLRVVPIYMPPLRERSGDVELLAQLFVQQLNARGGRQIDGISREAWAALRSYDWPGNVRELANVIECAFVVGEGARLQFQDLTPEVRGEVPPTATGDLTGGQERGRILEALARHQGRVGRAARDLGISRTTLWRKLSVIKARHEGPGASAP